MFYLLSRFSEHFEALNLLRYINFRTGGAIVTALLCVRFFEPRTISWLGVKHGKRQPIRTDGPSSLLSKHSGPSMGRLMILSSLTVSMLLWSNLASPYVWVMLLVTLGLSSTVNLTDALKGRAIVPVTVVAGGLGFVTYLSGNALFSAHLQIPFVPGIGELAVISGAMIGAGFGFLLLNVPPRRTA
jgi:phospho-N-acetylmuramoyl-pentapeptide-transferase